MAGPRKFRGPGEGVDPVRKWHANPWAVLVTLSLGFFMTLLDLTIVNIAIPEMIDGLGASLDQTLWVVSGYALVLAVLLISAGRLGDLFGPRNLFAAGLAIFTLASIACGMAAGPALLIAARAVQGLGAALLVPQTMTLIVSVFPAQRRGAAMGIWGMVAGLATLSGPTLGGILVSTVGWRWIFLVNVPIGLAALALTFLVVPDIRHGRKHRFDVMGVLIATAALFCLTFGLQEGEHYHWGPGIWALLAAGASLVAGFLLNQRGKQDQEPLVPFTLFRDRNFTVMTVLVALVSMAMIGLVLPFNLYLQSVLHMSAIKAGMVLAPSSLVSMTVGPFAGRLSDRIGGKYLLMAGLTLYATGMLAIVLTAGVATPGTRSSRRPWSRAWESAAWSLRCPPRQCGTSSPGWPAPPQASTTRSVRSAPSSARQRSVLCCRADWLPSWPPARRTPTRSSPRCTSPRSYRSPWSWPEHSPACWYATTPRPSPQTLYRLWPPGRRRPVADRMALCWAASPTG